MHSGGASVGHGGRVCVPAGLHEAEDRGRGLPVREAEGGEAVADAALSSAVLVCFRCCLRCLACCLCFQSLSVRSIKPTSLFVCDFKVFVCFQLHCSQTLHLMLTTPITCRFPSPDQPCPHSPPVHPLVHRCQQGVFVGGCVWVCMRVHLCAVCSRVRVREREGMCARVGVTCASALHVRAWGVCLRMHTCTPTC